MAERKDKDVTIERADFPHLDAQPDEPRQADAPRGDDAGQAEVQQRVDRENAQGFVGVETDPTPNEHYAVQGVTSGKPTPETHPFDDVAREARRAAGFRV